MVLQGRESNMFKVTFQSQVKVKEGRKWVTKTFTNVEEHTSEANYRLRALALNWSIVSVETTGATALAKIYGA